MTSEKIDAPRYVAVHEAGHAVVRIVSSPGPSVVFDYVEVRPRDSWIEPVADTRGRESRRQGRVEGPGVYDPLGVYVPEIASEENQPRKQETLDLLRRRMDAEVLICVAGVLAEARYRKMSILGARLGGGADDYEHVERVARDFARDDDEADRIVREGEKRCSGILTRHWAAVLGLADALLDRGRLTYEEAMAVIASVSPQSTPSCEWQGT